MQIETNEIVNQSMITGYVHSVQTFVITNWGRQNRLDNWGTNEIIS
jgi:hypothetical protein